MHEKQAWFSTPKLLKVSTTEKKVTPNVGYRHKDGLPVYL